jgi:ATP-dependent helicase/nuclease subunit A
MSQANSEQLKAIEHFGGVLLKAGAGSGKTFVLIHHIEYLLNDFLF